MNNKSELLKSIKGNWAAANIRIKYKNPLTDMERVFTTGDSYRLVLNRWDKSLINLQEQLMAFYFGYANNLIGYRLIATGSNCSCAPDICLIVSLALHSMASRVVLAHNHPTGQLIPSAGDKNVTRRLREALALIDIVLIDHLIISETGYYSMSDHNDF